MDTSAAAPAAPSIPPSVRSLRTLALIALALAAVVLITAKLPWWKDTSALSGKELQAALASAPSQAAADCLRSGGIPVGSGSGNCAKWEVLHPAMGISTDTATTFGGPGNSVVNDGRPQPLLGFPPAAIFAALAFVIIALSAATRSLLGSVAALLLNLQAYRALTSLAKVINQPVPGLPMLERTMWCSLFHAAVLVGGIVTVGGVLVWNVTARVRERQAALEDGTHVPFAERFGAFARAAMSTSSRSVDATGTQQR